MDNRTTRSEMAAATETMPNRQAGKFPLKWVIAGIIAFLVIGGTAAYALLINKSPKQLYLLSEIKTFQKAAEDFDHQNGELADFQEELAENASNTKTKISGGLDAQGALPPEFEMIQELLNEAAITTEVEQDPKKDRSYTKAGIAVQGENLLDMEIYQTPKQVAAKVPSIYEKYFYLNANEYGQFMRQLDPAYSGPEKLDFKPVDIKDLELNEKEEKHLKDTYAAFLNEKLKDEYFTKKDNVSYEHNGEKLKVTQVTMKLNEKETKALISQLLDQMIKDKELHTIIANRVVKIGNSGASQMDMIDPDTVKTDFVDGLKDAKKEVKETRIPKGFTSVLMVNGDELVIDRKMDVTVADSTEPGTAVSIHTMDVPYDADKKRDQELKVDITSDKEDEGGSLLLTNKINKKEGEDRTEDLKAKISSKDPAAEGSLIFSMKSDFSGKDPAKQTIKRDFSLGTEGGTGSPVKLEGTVIQKQDVSVKDKYSSQLFEIKVNGGADMAEGSISLKIDSKTKLKAKADLPDINLDNEINVNSITPEQMTDIQLKAGAKLQALFLQLGIL
ncbi:hypothetical protein CEF21_00895 [Bacillus sp. FJAT-42376]|uniref:DUF6583 family protein n=1 Tax=Bacillus sp. FJAT-42376 TaxID=2014076 RepID=UPI000F50C33E|nr:DUF6583 family protein [Bacillus sp. FJAT-42376]AZB41012.1 hypothetical protein CEF21_00895 [Bacillus sp. FJAT-42376]